MWWRRDYELGQGLAALEAAFAQGMNVLSATRNRLKDAEARIKALESDMRIAAQRILELEQKSK